MDKPAAEISCVRCGAANRRGEALCANCRAPLSGDVSAKSLALEPTRHVSRMPGLLLLIGLHLLVGATVIVVVGGSLVVALYLICGQT